MEPAPDKPRTESGHWWLPAGFAVIILLMVAVTGIGIERMRENSESMEAVINRHNVKIDLTLDMYTIARERSMTLLSMVAMEDPFDREEKREYYVDLGGRFAAARAEFVARDLNEQEQALMDRQGELSRVIVPVQDRVIDLLDQGDQASAVAILLGEGIPAQDDALAQLKEILDYQYELAREALEETGQVVRRTSIFMSLLAFLAVFLSAGVAIIVIRKTRSDERALREAKDTLEMRVAERTQELSQAYTDIEGKNSSLESLSNKLAKYLSPQVYASIFSGKQEVRLASQRKKLTIFFSDIAGFTEVTDRMESEDLTQLINHYLAEMSKVALDHGATIDKYVGDGIMIFFGDPETRGVKEDALACVRMAIAMQKRMEELQEGWRESGLEAPLSCRMGIHTGYCTVGNFGSEDRMDYTIIGAAVNLASRLEHESPEDGILISNDTYVRVKDEIACEEAGKIRVRGMAYPVATYLVRNARASRSHADERVVNESPHLRLEADFASMTPEEREEAAAALREALTRVSIPEEVEGLPIQPDIPPKD